MNFSSPQKNALRGGSNGNAPESAIQLNSLNSDYQYCNPNVNTTLVLNTDNPSYAQPPYYDYPTLNSTQCQPYLNNAQYYSEYYICSPEYPVDPDVTACNGYGGYGGDLEVVTSGYGVTATVSGSSTLTATVCETQAKASCGGIDFYDVMLGLISKPVTCPPQDNCTAPTYMPSPFPSNSTSNSNGSSSPVDTKLLIGVAVAIGVALTACCLLKCCLTSCIKSMCCPERKDTSSSCCGIFGGKKRDRLLENDRTSKKSSCCTIS